MSDVSFGAGGRARGRAVLIAFIAMLASTIASTSSAQERVALVIGNGAYVKEPRIKPLANPRNDAADIAAMLSRMGFTVITGTDLKKSEMEIRIRQFSDKLKQETTKVALFYYAGHGMQVEDKNYLLPVDASVKDVDQLYLDVIKLDTVLKQMENYDRANLIFLDACRNNPFVADLSPRVGTRSINIVPSGLANIDSGAGLFISFAAAPNKEALDGNGQRNSPFTAALLKHLDTPGLDIARIQSRVTHEVFNKTNRFQVPWSHSSLFNEVVLVAAQPRPQTGGPSVTMTPSREPDIILTRPDYAAECDEEAGYRDDPDRPLTNRYRAYKDIEPQKALRICRLARDNSPSRIIERRMRLQIGRALAEAMPKPPTNGARPQR